MNRYRLEVTEAQFRAIELACEVCARIKIGQPGMAVSMLGVTDGKGENIMDYGMKRDIDIIIKPMMGLAMNASFGVGKFVAADNLFDLHEAIRYRLSWDAALADGLVQPGESRRWPEMFEDVATTSHTWGDQPLAVVTKIEEVT